MEEWRQIEGYENYSVSDLGNVRNDKTGRILKVGTMGFKTFCYIVYLDNSFFKK
jgi:hypothetical protein